MVATELGVRLRDWFLKSQGRGEDLQLTYHLPWLQCLCKNINLCFFFVCVLNKCRGMQLCVCAYGS